MRSWTRMISGSVGAKWQALALFFALFFSSNPRAVTVSITPANQSAVVGTETSFNVEVGGLASPGPLSVGAFDFVFNFPPGLLSFKSITFGQGLAQESVPVNGFTPAQGNVNAFEISLDSPEKLDELQPGTFVLATFLFDAIAEGTGPLSLSGLLLADALGNGIGDLEILGAQINVRAQGVPDFGNPLPVFGASVLSLLLVRRVIRS